LKYFCDKTGMIHELNWSVPPEKVEETNAAKMTYFCPRCHKMHVLFIEDEEKPPPEPGGHRRELVSMCRA